MKKLVSKLLPLCNLPPSRMAKKFVNSISEESTRKNSSLRHFGDYGKMRPPWDEFSQYTEGQQWAGFLLGLALAALEVAFCFYLVN